MTNPALPRWLWLPAGVAVAFLTLPVLALLVRAPWSRFPELLATPAARDALALSAKTCAASTALVVLLGLPLSLVLAGGRGRWVGPVRVIATLPMALPPVVAGVALLTAFGRRGLLGAQLSALGLEIPFTTSAVVIAQTFVALPFFVVAVEGGLRAHGDAYERVAATLGAGPGMVLARITLPLTARVVLAGTAMAAARVLGEFGATLAFAGSLAGTTRTLPLEIYLRRETDPALGLALSVVLLGVGAVLLAAVGALGQRDRSRA